MSHVQYLLSGIERMAVAAEKRSSLSTVAAENERIDWIVFSKLYLFLVRRQANNIDVIGECTCHRFYESSKRSYVQEPELVG